jgi:hypothetical protein
MVYYKNQLFYYLKYPMLRLHPTVLRTFPWVSPPPVLRTCPRVSPMAIQSQPLWGWSFTKPTINNELSIKRNHKSIL